MRGGRVTGSLPYFFTNGDDADPDLLEAFLKQYYSPDRFVPDEILAPQRLAGQEALLELLAEQKGAPVHLLFPRQGHRRQLLGLAAENAQAALQRQLSLGPQIDPGVELQERLKLNAPPRRLACLDISNLQGSQAVGAMAVFWDGQPDKTAYRRYRIQEVEGQNDPAMLAEIIRRQFGDPEASLPDLLVIDGGLGQLSMVVQNPGGYWAGRKTAGHRFGQSRDPGQWPTGPGSALPAGPEKSPCFSRPIPRACFCSCACGTKPIVLPSVFTGKRPGSWPCNPS